MILENVSGPGAIVRAVEAEMGILARDRRSDGGWKSVRARRGDEELGSLWDIRQAYHFALREGDYKTFLEGTPPRHRRRLLKLHKKMGFMWLDDVPALFKKVALSDVSLQPLATVMPLSAALSAELERVVQPGFRLLRIDGRVLNEDGIPMPERTGLEEFLARGPRSFPTEYTRRLASAHGPGWSGGLAHLGSLALGYPLMNQSPKTLYVPGGLEMPLPGQWLSRQMLNVMVDDCTVASSEENAIKSVVRRAYALGRDRDDFRQPLTPPFADGTVTVPRFSHVSNTLRLAVARLVRGGRAGADAAATSLVAVAPQAVAVGPHDVAGPCRVRRRRAGVVPVAAAFPAFPALPVFPAFSESPMPALPALPAASPAAVPASRQAFPAFAHGPPVKTTHSAPAAPDRAPTPDPDNIDPVLLRLGGPPSKRARASTSSLVRGGFGAPAPLVVLPSGPGPHNPSAQVYQYPDPERCLRDIFFAAGPRLRPDGYSYDG